jgi:hypothetical protein
MNNPMISQMDMQRELHAYAMAEMRNRGLEEAARLLFNRAARTQKGVERYDLERWVAEIRALKTDPSKCLSDWWAEDKPQLPQETTHD